jgi:hypothetical protein
MRQMSQAEHKSLKKRKYSNRNQLQTCSISAHSTLVPWSMENPSEHESAPKSTPSHQQKLL